MAAGEGFEPSHTESESAVLPLHKPAIFFRSRERRIYYTKIYWNVNRKVKRILTIFLTFRDDRGKQRKRTADGTSVVLFRWTSEFAVGVAFVLSLTALLLVLGSALRLVLGTVLRLVLAAGLGGLAAALAVGLADLVIIALHMVHLLFNAPSLPKRRSFHT